MLRKWSGKENIMSIETNKTYKIRSAISSTRMLNLYSSGTAANGMNVVLYTSDDSNEQKWLFDGDRLRPKTNTNFCLDRYTASTYLNNADIWKASASDAAAQKIEMLSYGIYYYIRLQTKVGGKDYYLTAGSNTNGNATAAGKKAGANGNVYWAEQLNGGGDYHQLWFFTEDSGSSSGGPSSGEETITNQTLHMPVDDMRITSGYKAPAYLTDPETSQYGTRYGADYRDVNVSGSTVVPNNILASGEGYVYRSGLDANAGYFACIVYPKAYIKASSSGARKYQDITVRYWHMDSLNSDYNNIDYTNPKRIHNRDVIGTMGQKGVATGIHLHVECDTDTTPKYTFWSPTHWKSPDKLKNGTDSTINPGWVFTVGANQTVIIKQSKITNNWVTDDDYKYLGSYEIENA